MSLETLMGQPLSQIRRMNPDEGFDLFAEKTQERNQLVDKPAKYKIAVPMSFGIILGASIAVLSRRRG
jgi:hypothetical protein